MYYSDLSPFPKGEHRSALTAKAVGWLSGSYLYPKGSVSSEFIEKLLVFCCNAAIYSFGYHDCEFCNGSQFLVQCGHKARSLGSGEMVVFDKGEVYVAPNLIYHYVVDHDYQPPNEFIQAVLQTPLPDSEEYAALLRKYLYFGKDE